MLKPTMKPTTHQIVLAQTARNSDLLKMSNKQLREMLLYLGLGTGGTREELIERLHRQIWLNAYN